MSHAARPMVKAGNRIWKEIVNPNWIRDSRTGSYSKSFSSSCPLQLKQLQGRCPITYVRLSPGGGRRRSEEHTSELQSLMRISYAVFCLKKKNNSQISEARDH